MKFIYTQHAKLRISQRKLSPHQIEETISKPDKILPGFKGRSIVRKGVGKQQLEVVYKKLNQEIVIITAYWLKER